MSRAAEVYSAVCSDLWQRGKHSTSRIRVFSWYMALLITRTCLGDQILVSAIIEDSANIDFGKLQLISDSRAEIAGGHLDPPPSLPSPTQTECSATTASTRAENSSGLGQSFPGTALSEETVCLWSLWRGKPPVVGETFAMLVDFLWCHFVGERLVTLCIVFVRTSGKSRKTVKLLSHYTSKPRSDSTKSTILSKARLMLLMGCQH